MKAAAWFGRQGRRARRAFITSLFPFIDLFCEACAPCQEATAKLSGAIEGRNAFLEGRRLFGLGGFLDSVSQLAQLLRKGGGLSLVSHNGSFRGGAFFIPQDLCLARGVSDKLGKLTEEEAE